MASFLDRILADKHEQVRRAQKTAPLPQLEDRIAADNWTARSFETRLAAPGPSGVNVIAEIKRASPSKGVICADLDAGRMAEQYALGGAAAISVLTDGPYFHGALADLEAARRATELPVLRKEFIISDYQVYESRAAGADAILLIARILSAAQLADLLALAHRLGMGALVEIHSHDDYHAAHGAGARLIGINNRNLQSFDTDIGRAMKLAGLLEEGEVAVAASGIGGRSDVDRNLSFGIFNFLIGETLVRADDTVDLLRRLVGEAREGD